MSIIGLYVTVFVAMVAMAAVNAVQEKILDRRWKREHPHL